MKSRIILYSYWRSSCSWRVRWALEHKALPYEMVYINLLKGEHKSPEYLKKNPSGLIPSIEIDGQIYGESLAILELLEELFPAAPLLPVDPLSRGRVRQISLMIVAGIHPLQNMSVGRTVSEDATLRLKFASHWIDSGLKKVETLLEKTAGTFCIGSQLTFADLCLVPQCYNALRHGLKLESYPLVYRIYKHCLSLEACKAASPENQSDAVLS